MAGMSVTWDGLPVARERPFAVAIVVWRERRGDREFLLLHRTAPGGAEFEGDWAWTPPAGARQPGEAPDAAAERELMEETGLRLSLTPLPEVSASDDVFLYAAEAPLNDDVTLDHEHDRHLWLPIEDAVTKCRPSVVASGLANAAVWIERQAEDRTGLRIEPLGLHPDLVPVTVTWHIGAFDPDGDAVKWTRAREAEARLSGIPCAWVAFARHEPVGTVSLTEHNMDTRPDLRPWLAALFVLPEFRRRGIGASLVRRCESEAMTLGEDRLYLYTFNAEPFYERLGWSVLSREPYEEEPVTVMERRLR